jgi:alpha-ribazole phosphatase/probable phosphoglycerate mutase
VSRLVLVRHAEPAEDAHGLCYGSLDVGLSDEGRRHAAELATVLVGTAYDAVYTSPRLRARETAAPLGAARGLTPVVVDDLREIDFGDFEGRRYDEIEQSEPELFRAWMETPTRVRFLGGESYADLRLRALRALDAIKAAHTCAVVVTHGGVARAGLAEWLGMPDEAIFRLGQSYGGITIVDWLDGTPVLRLLNGSGRAVVDLR